MAISVVATVGASASASRNRALTFSSWTPQLNDVVVMFGSSNSITTITTPSGWTNVLGGNTVVSTSGNSLFCVFHQVTAGEVSAVTMTYTASNIWAGSTAGAAWGLVLRGVDPTTPLDSSNSTSNSSTTTTGVLPGLTGTNLSTNSMIVAGITTYGTSTFTTPAGWTVRDNTVSGDWVGTKDTLTTANSDVASTNITQGTSRSYASISAAFTVYVPAATAFSFFPLFQLPPVRNPVYDSGLKETFLYADPATGTTRSITSYGAVVDTPGNNAKTAITDALAASSAGDTVYIPNGNWWLSGGAGISCPAGVTILGQSRDGAILNTNFSSTVSVVFYIATGANGVILDSFTLQQDTGSNFTTGIRFSDEVVNASSVAVDKGIVRNIHMENFYAGAVSLMNTRNVLVENCVLLNANALDGGGQGYGVTIDGPMAYNNIIRNNTIGPVIRHAILFTNLAHHNLATLNSITGAVADAIDCHGESEYSNEISFNTVRDNVLNGTTQSPNGAGICLGEPPSGDTTIGGGTHDKSGTRNWVHHNSIYNCPQGVLIMNQSNYEYVEDNYIYGCDDGVLINQTDGYPITGVDYASIVRNTIDNCGYGIRLIDTVTGAKVANNFISGSTNYAIYGDSNTTKYLVANNTLLNNEYNIQLDSTDGTFIEGSNLPEAAFSELNVPRSARPIPANTSGCFVTLIGGGGAGGLGYKHATSDRGGGGGAGGGARIDRTWIPVASLGPTYSVTVGAGGTSTCDGSTGTSTDGGNTVFSSGSISLTAGGGKKGGNGTNNTVGAGGAGGTVIINGITATGYAGSAGGNGGHYNSSASGGIAGSNNTNHAGAGGGGGAGVSGGGGTFVNSNGGAGGNSDSLGGAATLTSGNPLYNNAVDGTGSQGGGGGSGAALGVSYSSSVGGKGGKNGGGGGGSSATNNTLKAGGAGGQGYILVEWERA